MLGWLLRFVALLVLVLVTWNPEGRSFVHWVGDWQGRIESTQALVGTGLWMLADWTDAQLSARAISYLVLVAIAFVLASAISWQHLRSALARKRDGSPRET